MSQHTATVFGGAGFLGNYVVSELVKKGYLVKVVSRNPERVDLSKTADPVGKIVHIKGNILSKDDIKNAVNNADLVINLVGILFEKGKQSFSDIHAKAAENIAIAAKEAGVSKLLHVSALGVGKHTKSKYLRTKMNGEKAILAAFPEAIILRPSIIFGFEDNFFNKFAKMLTFLPFLPLIGNGKTLFQPIYVVDVAKIITAITEHDRYLGRVIEIGGSQKYSFHQLMDLVADYTNRLAIKVPVPFFAARILGTLSSLMPTPIITNDQVTMLQTDNVVTQKNSVYETIGITPTSLEIIVPEYLKIYRKS